jgi:hypothetical protein
MQTIYHIVQKSIILILYCLFCLAGRVGYSQIPSGAWRDHLPYNHANHLVEYDNHIYCATSDGSVFSFDTQDNSIKKHSKVNGLSDADVSTIGFSAATQTLFIGYKNGNIDLVKNDSVFNIPDIKRKMIIGEKSVNNVFFLNNYAYLACGFGIVLCDLTRREIKDTYFFGSGGAQIYVNDITSDGLFLYAATREGIYKAEISNPNLLDFNAWEHLLTLPDPEAEYRFVAWYNNTLFTVFSNPVSGFDDIITVDGSGWEIWTKSYSDIFGYLGEQHGYLVFSSASRTKVYGAGEELVRDNSTYYGKHALFDSKQGLWYADPISGLVRIDASGNGTVIVPDGPAFLTVGDIEILSGNLWAGGGTDASKWTGYGAYSFINEKWTAYNRNTIPAMENFLNISEIAIDPLDPWHIIGGSYGYGIAEFKNGVLIDIEDETNGIFLTVPGYEGTPGYVRVTGTDYDAEGNLYISTSNSEQAVYRKMSGKDWEALQFDYEGFGFNTNVGEILATTGGQFWLLVEGSGVFVFKENDDGSFQERLFAARNQVPVLLDRVYAIAEDKEGYIWVGTNKGPAVYFNPSEIFEAGTVTGYQPEIPRNDGTLIVDLLLSTEKINDIEVDGANQKWFATENSGVFLVSPDGKKEIHHFTAENSPLLSNNVQTLAANDKTGEVFFGTDKGIISYRGIATVGGDDFGKVYVFPNPVRENFDGDITVTGLAGNVNVKITDIAGNLVFETTSLGGQAVWNGRNFRGDRVQTGVYLVFCTNDDGSKTHVTKLLFIH